MIFCSFDLYILNVENIFFYIFDSAGAVLFFLFFLLIKLINDFDMKYGFSGEPSFRSRSSRIGQNTPDFKHK